MAKAKKWRKPCKLCNGKNKRRCMICGWKNEPKKISEMDNMELAELRGKRERVSFLHGLDRQSTRAGNSSTDDQAVDKLITEHREYAIGLYKRALRNEDLREVAKSEQLTEKLVRAIVQMVSDKLYRGEMELETNESVVANPPTVPPPPAWYHSHSFFQPGKATFKAMQEMPEPPGQQEW